MRLVSAWNNEHWAAPVTVGRGDYLTYDGMWWRCDAYTKQTLRDAERPRPDAEHQLPTQLTAKEVANLLYDRGYAQL